MTTPRRSGWVVLLAVAGVVLGGAFAVRVTKRKPPAQPAPPAPAPKQATPPDPSRSLARMAVGAGIAVVLALTIVVATRPSEVDRTASPAATTAGPMPLAECQAAVAARPNPSAGFTCGYTTESDDGAAADPRDPRYAGAALPVGLSTDGLACVTGPDRPILDTVHPVLSASFTAAPGLRHVAPTFQLRGVFGRTDRDMDHSGDFVPAAEAATLKIVLYGRLEHGVSYRWRIRGTPAYIPAGGWSPWCEFTIATTTPDDLGVDDGREYPVALPGAKWREMLAVLGPVETHPSGDKSAHAPIADAVKTALPPARRVAVTLTGRQWKSVANDLAYWASEKDAPAYWNLADQLSAALGGPPMLTMGFPRP